MSEAVVIYTRGLAKSYGNIQALRGVDLEVGRMDHQSLLGLLGFSLLFVLLALWRFQRRDIRVGGEGSWQIPGLLGWGNRKTQGGM